MGVFAWVRMRKRAKRTSSASINRIGRYRISMDANGKSEQDMVAVK